MPDNATDECKDYIDKSSCVGISLAGTLLGFLIGIVVLVFTPSLYRRLRYGKKHMSKLYCYFINCPRREEPEFSPRLTYTNGTTRHYTEIDEESIRRTLPLQNMPAAQYEDMVIDNKHHRYSTLDVHGGRYEDVAQQSQRMETNVSDKQPIYHILEPSTYKRLPVRLYTRSAAYDDNNVYFVLEPNSNNVKPTFEKPSTDSDHTYFVLEPDAMMDATIDVEAYAVSDLAESHGYFILEKTYN